MRGKVALLLHVGIAVGITPAYAGKSRKHIIGRTFHRDHPRICGEKGVIQIAFKLFVGSPPHMRGKVAVILYLPPSFRITPAYAGKRTPTARRTHRWEDHPRICGEKHVHLMIAVNSRGSPPHMRGKVIKRDRICALERITPAYAGKSLYAGSLDLCGNGSPPHMRGKVASWKKSTVLMGITPAYAGKRLKRSRSTVPPVAIVPLFPSVCNKPVVSDGSPAGRDAPLFLPAENAVPASPAYNLRSL